MMQPHGFIAQYFGFIQGLSPWNLLWFGVLVVLEIIAIAVAFGLFIVRWEFRRMPELDDETVENYEYSAYRTDPELYDYTNLERARREGKIAS